MSHSHRVGLACAFLPQSERHLSFGFMFDTDESQRPNHALQRTRHGVAVGNHCVPCAGSLSLGR
jgi:hypothetical protein